MSEFLMVERRGAVVEVVLNRPERRNAFSPETMRELARVLTGVAGETGLGVVILRGAGGFFSSGLDLKEIDLSSPPTDDWMAVHRALAELDLPVIAALTGGAVNAGAALALACDLMIVGENAYLQVKEAAMGMVPPVNIAWLATRQPMSVSAQLVLSCRRFSGADLHRLGVALDVVPDDQVVETARRLADELAGFPQTGGLRTKRILRETYASSGAPFADLLEVAQKGRRTA